MRDSVTQGARIGEKYMALFHAVQWVEATFAMLHEPRFAVEHGLQRK
jgi:hypothetical protein